MTYNSITIFCLNAQPLSRDDTRHCLLTYLFRVRVSFLQFRVLLSDDGDLLAQRALLDLHKRRASLSFSLASQLMAGEKLIIFTAAQLVKPIHSAQQAISSAS